MTDVASTVLSVVVPVYQEQENVVEFLRKTVPILQSIDSRFEIIFALDPSHDATETVILSHREKDPRLKLLRFSRRVGQPMATLAGLQYSSGDAVIVMDVDLQDPPELLTEMVAKWREGFDVVMAQRSSRKGETLVKRFVSYWGYKLINRIANPPIPPHTGDFRLMSRRVVDELKRLKECHGFLRGLVSLVGFKQTSVQFERPERFAGKGNYNRLLGSLRIGLNGIICFSGFLPSLSSLAGFAVLGLSLLLAALRLLALACAWPFPVPHTLIIFSVLLLGGVQLLSLGILGEYVTRIYDEVKQRPKFIVDQATGFDSLRPPADAKPGASAHAPVSSKGVT